ncbi:hypothetical protein LIER_35431 [Lithospermum erythrorhizon]|uniref:Uncharacterized protein n=1 Tax=Lithospermum erythrorhizon TaxID=34254 RepID=A0AAV3NQN3_LITER
MAAALGFVFEDLFFILAGWGHSFYTPANRCLLRFHLLCYGEARFLVWLLQICELLGEGFVWAAGFCSLGACFLLFPDIDVAHRLPLARS